MNMITNIILNITKKPKHYSHIDDSFIASDTSCLKVYSTREKINKFFFPIKFFLFIFLIWILQCSNNCTCRPMDTKYILKDKFDLRTARLLAEGRRTDVIKTNLPIEIEQMCSERDTELLQENVKEKITDNKLLYRNILRKISFFSVVILPIIFIVIEIFLDSNLMGLFKKDIILVSLYLTLYSLFIIRL
ncbi:Plasmodium exported protein, unknown function [Plasmodium relictum]|uniref:Fam-h protein n=2 Tax=Plasmodium relictum TaxID=85471 RepID=A0A1J1GKQ4_PLARL|nr:Plasmodium exported protein, unknown function [Plasmodium relictum]CRG85842.1 Plasmodium exported protein, unknown function [Plasmodium relictum]